MSDPTSDFFTPGRILADGKRALRLLPSHLARHVFIGGNSGGGKSKLIELLCRQLVGNNIGFTYVDPHGDGAEAVMKYFAVRRVAPERVHYLRPGIDRCFSFDPFAHPPRNASPRRYESWLIATVERTVDAFLRNVALADQEVMKRLKRWLGNVLYAAGVDVGGRHLGLSDALILTQPDTPRFDAVLSRVRAVLRPEILADFDMLARMKSSATRNTLLESTINCLREVLSPATDLLFSQSAPSIDQREVILKSGFQIVNLRKSDEFSRRQRSVVGGLLINFLIHAAENLGEELPPEQRVPHVLIIDEAENFVGEDLRMGFAELRKFRLSLCLAVQDLSCLRRGELDLVGKVISQCGLQMTFQQGEPDDIEYLGKAFGYGSLDFTPLIVDTVLPDGYDWVETESVSIGESKTHTESHSTSVSHTQSSSCSRSTSDSIQQNVSRALSAGESTGTSTSRSSGGAFSWSHGDTTNAGHSTSTQLSTQAGTSETRQWSQTEATAKSEQRGENITKSETHSDGKSVQQRSDAHMGMDVTTRSKGDARATGAGVSSMEGTSQSRGTSEGGSVGVSRNEGVATGNSDSVGRGSSDSTGGSTNESNATGTSAARTIGTSITTGVALGHSGSESVSDGQGTSTGRTAGFADAIGESHTVTHGMTPLARHRILARPTGSLVRSVQDQIAEVMNTLASLPDRVALVKCRGMNAPFLIHVHDVLDPYDDAALIRSVSWQEDDQRLYMAAVLASHNYHFVPSDGRTDGVTRFMRADNEQEDDGSRRVADDAQSFTGDAARRFGRQPILNADEKNPFDSAD